MSRDLCFIKPEVKLEYSKKIMFFFMEFFLTVIYQSGLYQLSILQSFPVSVTAFFQASIVRTYMQKQRTCSKAQKHEFLWNFLPAAAVSSQGSGSRLFVVLSELWLSSLSQRSIDRKTCVLINTDQFQGFALVSFEHANGK